MTISIGDSQSILFAGLSGFWQKFFKDSKDIQAYYQASEIYLGQVYLDLLGTILNIGAIDTPIFNKEYWKLFPILETELDFLAAPTVSDNRFVYDMPDATVKTDFLQNSIFEPDVLLERDVDFEVLDDDGLVRFKEDPFRQYQDSDGNWGPASGVAWRTLRRSVGNRLQETTVPLYPTQGETPYEVGVRRGDSLRLLAQRGPKLETGVTGTLVKAVDVYTFSDVNVGTCKVGDVLQVYGHDGSPGDPDDLYRGFYVVKEWLGVSAIKLEPLSVRNTTGVSSTTNLYWRLYRAHYYDVPKDYEVDLQDGYYVIGAVDTAYPLDQDGPFVYAYVRSVPQSDISGVALTYLTWIATGVPVGTLPGPQLTDLGQRQLEAGSVTVYAYKARVNATDPKIQVEENVDYSVDYGKGLVYQLTYWDSYSTGKVSYTYLEEIFFSGAGTISELAVGNVRQLSLWTPEVLVDKFNLYYNYGTLLNRFEVSSEVYKSFLMGIMYLYMTGPILQRIEAALNVAAEFPVVKLEGEVLTGFTSGIVSSGITASIDAPTVAVTISTLEYVLSDLDVGGSFIFADAVNANNNGTFQILSVNTTLNSAVLETTYGFTTESSVNWSVTHTNVNAVTTNKRTYTYPLSAPLRADIQDPLNFNVLTFEAFEPLTLAFKVTDYVEDPYWWHDKHIPAALWEGASRSRRRATTQLFEHVLGADDASCIGDPGLFIGASDDGIVFEPTDPGTGDLVSLHRHNAAFVIFDQYLKMHMFYVEFALGLELDEGFKEDLEELVLVAKPSYTLPYVEPNARFIDNIILDDTFNIGKVTFLFGEGEVLGVADNNLVIGDTDFPWNFGDFFKYDYLKVTTVPVTNPILVSTVVVLSSYIPAGCSLLNLVVAATRVSDGEPALEGRDYTVNWLAQKPIGTVNPLAWDVIFLTECTAGGTNLEVEFWYAERLNGSYDTTLGWTPIIIGGTNPWYIREGALDPLHPDEWLALRSEQIDRTLQLTIVDGGGSYTYP